MNRLEKSLEMSVLMTADMANVSGNIHGGKILALLDNVAYACASRYCKRCVVTLSIDQIFFKQPIHVGDLVTFKASINYTGTTSMEVGIRVEAEHIHQSGRRHASTGFFTMVALDEQNRPTAVPPLQIQTEEELQRHQAASKRREQRLSNISRSFEGQQRHAA